MKQAAMTGPGRGSLQALFLAAMSMGVGGEGALGEAVSSPSSRALASEPFCHSTEHLQLSGLLAHRAVSLPLPLLLPALFPAPRPRLSSQAGCSGVSEAPSSSPASRKTCPKPCSEQWLGGQKEGFGCQESPGRRLGVRGYHLIVMHAAQLPFEALLSPDFPTGS